MSVNWNPSRGQIRLFGLACLAAFGALGATAFFRRSLLGFDLSDGAGRAAGLALWCVAGSAGVLAAAAPAALRGLYRAMTLITLPIGFVVSHTVMAAVFYGVFTPVALLFRLIGRDAMARKADPSAASYWRPRKAVTDVRRYFRQS